MTHDVFLSYSSKDKAWADAACAVLEKNRIRCWIAPRDMTPGAEWGATLIQGLASSRIVVLIFSGHANASGQVRREVERAISSGKAVLPLRIENITPHGALEYALGNTHWLDAFTPPIEQQLALLAKSVATLLEIKTTATDDVNPNTSATMEPDRAYQNKHEPDAAPRLKRAASGSSALRRNVAIAVSLAIVFAAGAFLMRGREGNQNPIDSPIKGPSHENSVTVSSHTEAPKDPTVPTPTTPIAVTPSNTSFPATVTKLSTTTDPVDTTATDLRTIDVLARISANLSKKKRWEFKGGVAGDVRAAHPAREVGERPWGFKGGVAYASGSEADVLLLPVPIPEEYRLELTVARPRPGGKSDFWIGVICGENRCAVVLDGWAGSASGISNIDGKVAIYNETNYDGHIFQRAQPVNIVVTVRRRSINVTADGKTIVNWRGDPSRLSEERPMPLGPRGSRPLTIETFGGFYRIDKLTFTPLSPLPNF